MILGMTLFEFFLPIGFLALGAAAVLWTRHEGRVLDRRETKRPAE